MTHAAPPRQGRPWWPGPRPAAPAAAAHPALRALLDVALLAPEQAAAATVHDLSRAHSVWSVTGPGLYPVVVKTGSAHGGPELAVECLVYRMTSWCIELGRALPVALLVDEDRQLLVLADVAARQGTGSLAMAAGPPPLVTAAQGQHPWSGTVQRPGPPGPPADLTGVAARLGRTVGAVHRATAGLPLPPARPPTALALLLDPSAAGQLGPAVHRLAADLALDTALTAAATEFGLPHGSCLVNHDLKWDNVVLTGDASTVLVDWELAGRGDPAWDLGCLLAEHLCRAAAPEALDGGGRALLTGYAAGAHPHPEVAPVLARRVVLAAALRLTQMAVEVAHSAQVAAHPVLDGYLALARRVLVAATGLAAEVAGYLQHDRPLAGPTRTAAALLGAPVASPAVRSPDPDGTQPAHPDGEQPVDATSQTVADLRAALGLVAGDPEARALARAATRATARSQVPGAAGSGVPAHLQPDLDGDLASWLYARWWVGSRPRPSDADGDEEFLVPALEEARRGGSHVVPGLLVLAVDGDRLLVAPVPAGMEGGPSDGAADGAANGTEREPGLLVVALDAVAGSSRPGRPPRPGDLVSVLSGSSGAQPGTGWWWARTGWSDPAREELDGDLDRLYLNTTAAGAPVVVSAVLRAASAAGLALSLKCPSDATGFGRCDAVVVYHRRRDRGTVDALLPGLLRDIGPWLGDEAPPLTQQVAAGAGRAQDPGSGTSYGQVRCAQVAHVVSTLLAETHTGTLVGTDDRPDDGGPGGPVPDEALLAAARTAGIDPARPHLLTGAAR